MTVTAIIIPVRYDSERCPGKLFRKCVDGKTVLEHTIQRCANSVLPVYVVADSERTRALIGNNPFVRDVLVSKGQHTNGTDRVAEANENLQYEYVINVQGDQPLISIDEILKLYEFLIGKYYRAEKVFTTLGYCMPDRVVMLPEGAGTRRTVYHLGVYGFTRESLRRISKIPLGGNALEQNRITNWDTVLVGNKKEGECFSIDTEEDFLRFNDLLVSKWKGNNSAN